MVSLANKFADEFINNAVNIHRVEAGIRRKILSFLKGLEQELVDEIADYDIEGVSNATYKFQRSEALLKQVRETIKTGYAGKIKDLKSELIELADIQGLAIPKLMNRVLGGSVISTELTRGDLRALVSDTIIHGHPLSDWWSQQSLSLQNRFTQQIRLGVGAGETNDSLIQRIRGKFTGQWTSAEVNGKLKRVRDFSGGIMDTTTREASTLVRTSVQAISNQVIRETYDQNDDVVKGVGALVTLDHRTSTICIGRSGGMWFLNGDPMPESTVQTKYPGDPPWHPNCRTVLYPITYTWEEMIENAGMKRRKVFEEEIPFSHRASIDGKVPSNWDYEDWLKTKTAAQQNQILGVGKAKLWRDGKLTLQQLLDQSGNPLTLDSLRELV